MMHVLDDGRPLYALPREPAGHYRLAADIGELLAVGVISTRSAVALCHIIAHRSADLSEYQNDYPPSFANRLRRHAREARDDAIRKRANAEFFIRRAVKPLIAASEPRATVEAAAERENRGTLAWGDVCAIMREEFLSIRYCGRAR